jgi:hypothetical protein
VVDAQGVVISCAQLALREVVGAVALGLEEGALLRPSGLVEWVLDAVRELICANRDGIDRLVAIARLVSTWLYVLPPTERTATCSLQHPFQELGVLDLRPILVDNVHIVNR